MEETCERKEQVATTVIVNARPPSTSYIPRPISGVARRTPSTTLAPINHIQDLSSVSVSSQVRRFSQLPHKTCRRNDGMPPTSFLGPKMVLSQSNTVTSRNDPKHLNQVRIQPENESKDLHSSNNIVTGELATVFTPQRDIRTTSTQLSRNRREITPRTLMRPIQPSLPHSQSVGHLSLSTAAQWNSPSRPPRLSSLGLEMSKNIQRKAERGNSSLTPKPIQSQGGSLTQVAISSAGDDKQQGRTTKVPTSGTNAVKRSPAMCTDHRIPSSITLNLSVNDTANVQRLEEQIGRLSSRRPLFVNTTLANTATVQDSSPLTSNPPLSGATYLNRSSGVSPDPRSVYDSENVSYWAGRYSSASDHLRQSDFNILLGSKNSKDVKTSINSSEFEKKFDQLETTRQSRVLEELRQFCRTEKARRSFSIFEMQLKRGRKPSRFTRSYSELFNKPNRDAQTKAPTNTQAIGVRRYPANCSINEPPMPTAQTAIEKLSEIVVRRGGLIKSKTTGNLAMKPTATRISTPGLLRPSDVRKHPLKSSRFQEQPNTKASTNANSHDGNRGWEIQTNTALEDLSSLTRRTSDLSRCVQPLESTVANISNPLPKSMSELSLANSHFNSSELSGPTLVMNSIPEFYRPPVTHRTFTLHPPTEDNIKETVLCQPKRRNRQSSGQSSGEFVKKMVGASLREVRKVRRKVGSLGWTNSDDYLPGSQPKGFDEY